jgi:hypothetical protein
MILDPQKYDFGQSGGGFGERLQAGLEAFTTNPQKFCVLGTENVG